MEVKVVEQPDASKLIRKRSLRLQRKLLGYDPAPAFMLHWDKAKVNPEDLPAEKGAAKKPGRASRRRNRRVATNLSARCCWRVV